MGIPGGWSNEPLPQFLFFLFNGFSRPFSLLFLSFSLIIHAVGLWRKNGGRKMKFRRRGDGDERECAICMERFREREEVWWLSCRHLFHVACLQEWVALLHGTCPVCRCRVD
ncbi:hypothetical protein AMTRI_Chr01g137330 [Amborella trichopoda]